MSSVSAGSLIYRVRWSVNCSPTISLLIMRRESRLTSRENIGLECSSLRLGHGNTATLPIPMSGAMGTMPHLSPSLQRSLLVHFFPGRSNSAHCEIIFLKALSFLRLVSPPPHLFGFFAQPATSRSLCAQGSPPIQSPSKAHALERPDQRPDILPFVHHRIQPRHGPFPTRRHDKDSSPRDRACWRFAQCLTRGEHGVMLRWRAPPFQ